VDPYYSDEDPDPREIVDSDPNPTLKIEENSNYLFFIFFSIRNTILKL